MSSIESLPKIKEYIKSADREPDIVTEESYLKARANISAMCINNPEDAFLFYSSLNLLNTYVKQNKGKISYDFKSHATGAFDSIIQNKIPNITYSYDEKEGALIINVMGLQFSFHNVQPSAKMEFARTFEKAIGQKFCEPQEWDNIRLQPVAESLFTYANELEGLSNVSIAGDLKKLQSDYIAIHSKDTTMDL